MRIQLGREGGRGGGRRWRGRDRRNKREGGGEGRHFKAAIALPGIRPIPLSIHLSLCLAPVWRKERERERKGGGQAGERPLPPRRPLAATLRDC